MTQWEYDTINYIIQYGAPALYDHLIGSLQKLIAENNRLEEEVKKHQGVEETK